MSSIAPLDYCIIVLYLALMVAVGTVFTRFTRTSADYFKGGSRATWWLVGISLYMGCFSAWTFTGAAGVSYVAGCSILCGYSGSIVGYFLNYVRFARWFRQTRATTAPEAIAQRFGPRTAQFYAWIGVVQSLPFAAIALYGLGIFCSSVFQLELEGTIILTGAVVVIYSATGGAWSVMATDFLQALILIPLTIALAVVCLIEVGGPAAFWQSVQASGLRNEFALVKPGGAFPNDAYTWSWGAALFLRNLSYELTLTSAPRYFAVKDGREAAKAALLCIALLILGVLTWFLPPMTARLLYADDVIRVGVNLAKPAEAAYVVAGLKLLPAGFIGVMVIAMFAATMSGMDAGLNRNAAVIVRDILPSLCRRFGWSIPDEAAELRAGRWVTIALGIALVACALNFSADRGRGVFEIMTETGALLGPPMAVPMILAILISRTPPWAALFAVTLGFGASLCSYLSAPLFGQAWNMQTTVLATFSASAGAFLVTIPFWRTSPAAYRARVEAFFARMRSPVDFAREIGPASDLQQLRLLGWLTVVTGALLEILLVVPNPIRGRLLIFGVGGSVIAVGALMIFAARRRPGPNLGEPVISLHARDRVMPRVSRSPVSAENRSGSNGRVS